MLGYIIETDRLIIKELELNDANNLFKLMRLPETHQFSIFKPHLTVKDSIDFIQHRDIFYHKIGIFNKDTGDFIGMCSLSMKDIDGYPNGAVSIGYYLLPEFQGYGYATEIAKSLIKFSFEYLHVKRVYATCDPSNQRSYRVMERCGMQKEGIIRRDKYTIDGIWRDSLQYSILDNEYQYNIILEVHRHMT